MTAFEAAVERLYRDMSGMKGETIPMLCWAFSSTGRVDSDRHLPFDLCSKIRKFLPPSRYQSLPVLFEDESVTLYSFDKDTKLRVQSDNVAIMSTAGGESATYVFKLGANEPRLEPTDFAITKRGRTIRYKYDRQNRVMSGGYFDSTLTINVTGAPVIGFSTDSVVGEMVIENPTSAIFETFKTSVMQDLALSFDGMQATFAFVYTVTNREAVSMVITAKVFNRTFIYNARRNNDEIVLWHRFGAPQTDVERSFRQPLIRLLSTVL